MTQAEVWNEMNENNRFYFINGCIAGFMAARDHLYILSDLYDEQLEGKPYSCAARSIGVIRRGTTDYVTLTKLLPLEITIYYLDSKHANKSLAAAVSYVINRHIFSSLSEGKEEE